MKKENQRNKLIAMAVITATYSTTFAADLNHYGFAINTGSFSVKDPSGPTDTTVTSYISGIMTIPVNRNDSTNRYWLEINYRDFSEKADTTNIGQNVKALGLMGIYQHSFNVAEWYRPWIGIGAAANFSDYTTRQTVDSQGFLLTSYPDRKATNTEVVLNLGASLKKTEGGYYFGAQIIHHVPFDNGIKGTTIQAFMLF